MKPNIIQKLKTAPPKTLRSASIVGTGSYVPERIMTNADLVKIVETTDEWILSRSGIRERRIARPDETTSMMGAEAARRALADAKVAAEDVDLIIVGTMTPDMGCPNTGCFVQAQIGAVNAYCFDLEAACSGFIYSLEVARSMIAAGTVDTVLVIGAEKMSCIVDWSDRTTCVLFGDGAGCAVVQAREGSAGVLASAMGSDGNLADLLKMPGGGSKHPASPESLQQKLHFMKMGGREVFKHAVTRMTEAAGLVLAERGLTIEDVDLVVPHQANIRIVKAIGDRLGGKPEQYFVNLDKYGNTSAATIIIALDEAVKAGRLNRGDLLLMVAFGGGFTWGATLLEW